MADAVHGERFEGREPYRETPPEPRVYYMGDHGPFPGQAPSRPDENIQHDVDTALFYDDAVSSLGVDVSVQDGVVTLNGTVHSDLAKDLAGKDAWKVGGVRGVVNDLKVQESPTPSRAAGQDVVAAKPPRPGYGTKISEQPHQVPPAQQATAGYQQHPPQPQTRGQAGQQAQQGQSRKSGQSQS